MFRGVPVVPSAEEGQEGAIGDEVARRPSSPARRANQSRSSQSQLTDKWRSGNQVVTINFDDSSSAWSCPLAKQSAQSCLDERENMADVEVKRVWCIYPTFVHRSNPSCWDRGMEEKFGVLRYDNFCTAFVRASFIMMLGALGMAAHAFSQEFWRRSIALGGWVAPQYFCFGLYALRRRQQFLEMSGTWREKLLVALLCLQSLAINGSEWARPDFDYGMLVIHIGYVHNFTPLGAGHMQVVTGVFGLLPYVLLKVIRFSFNIYTFQQVVQELEAISWLHGEATHGRSAEQVAVRIAVPVVIFIYQVVVIMHRDESLRLDLLSRLNLGIQQTLLDNEKDRNEGLLRSMLPRKVIEDLKEDKTVEPQLFEDVTVIFAEICHFDFLCAKLLPVDVVEVLNIVYLELDRLSDLLYVYKVETVGQVYMAVVGCPELIQNHADVAVHFALAAQQSMVHARDRIARNFSHCGPMQPHQESLASGSTPGGLDVVIHVGLNSGPIRAGIVGIEAPRYKLFGDTVNTASRMESTCEPGRIQVSKSTADRLTKGMFDLEDRGEIPVKGKGYMRTFYVHDWADKSAPGVERQVVIEHGARTAMLTASASSSPAKADQKLKSDAWAADPQDSPRMGPTKSAADTIGESLVKSASIRIGKKDSMVAVAEVKAHRDAVQRFIERKKTTTSTTSVLVSAALGQNWTKEDPTVTQELSSSKATTYLESAAGSSNKVSLGWLDSLQLLFLLVPAEKKDPVFVAALRRDRADYQRAMHDDYVRSAKNLTTLWLFLLGMLSLMDYFMDVMRVDIDGYRMAIIVRALGNTLAGLGYLLLTLVPTVRHWVQPITVAMLALQGTALLLCGAVLYNGEPAIIAIYGAYILFYSVCTLMQRLALCLAAVIGHVVIQWVQFGGEGIRQGLDNITFVIIFIAAMACSVRLQEYLHHVSHWEQRLTERRLEEITLTKAAGSQLLMNLLPSHVVDLVGENLSSPTQAIAEHHSDVTILFTDIKGFTAYSSKISAQKLVMFLNSMYSAFDEIISNWALHKVEIIGDAYFVSAGCPVPAEGDKVSASEYAMRAVEVGMALLRTLPTVCDDTTVQMRVGLHTGSVVAGVVGKKGPRYHLFGSTVAYAEKMESHGVPGKVQISEATHELLVQGEHSYEFEERLICVDGQDGVDRTWLVNRSNSTAAFQIQKKLMTQRRMNQQMASIHCAPSSASSGAGVGMGGGVTSPRGSTRSTATQKPMTSTPSGAGRVKTSLPTPTPREISSTTGSLPPMANTPQDPPRKSRSITIT